MKHCPTCKAIFTDKWLSFCTNDGTTLVEGQSAPIQMKHCPTCKATFTDKWLSFCTNDGTTLVEGQSAPMTTVDCPECGVETSAETGYCDLCGENLIPEDSPRMLDPSKPESASSGGADVADDQTTFICYAREDQSFVKDLVSRLKKQGVRVWIDQFDIRAGEDWDQKIDDALYGCNHFLIVLSPSAIESHEVRSELHIALDEKKHIVPILLGACRVFRQLRSLQHIDFSSREAKDDELLRQLVNALLG